MLEHGEWVAENPESKIAGFFINALYSPVGWYSWKEAVREWLDLEGKPKDRKVFVNTVLGETWVDKGEAPEWKRLYNRREKYKCNIVPLRGLVLTAGVDVQKNRLEVEVVAWGRCNESWSIDYRVFDGDTSGDGPWDRLEELLAEQFEAEAPAGCEHGVPRIIRRVAVDTGYNTNHVYYWVRHQQADRVMAVKGSDTLLDMILGIPKDVDINHNGRKFARGVKLWPVASGIIKSELYGWLKMERLVDSDVIPKGWCHFPEYDEEYFKMLTAEQLVAKVVKGSKKYSWEKTRERNEALDCRVYARAAAAALGIDRWSDDTWEQLEASVAVSPAPRAEPTPRAGSGFITRREKGWLQR